MGVLMPSYIRLCVACVFHFLGIEFPNLFCPLHPFHLAMPATTVHVAIINLLCRKHRRQRILSLVAQLVQVSQNSALPIQSVHLVEAVDGVSESFSQLEARYGLKAFKGWAMADTENRLPRGWRSGQTSGGIASGLSHLEVAGLLNLGPDEVVLVMEDDCQFTSGNLESVWGHFQACLEDAKNILHDSNWHMLLLGAAGHRVDICPPRPISNLIEHAGFSYLTTMYFLSPSGAANLIANRPTCLTNMLAFDELHNALARTTLRPDVEERFKNTQPLILVSAIQSLVRQDPSDGVHDTTVSAVAREVAPPEPPPWQLKPHEILLPNMPLTWWRRELRCLRSISTHLACAHSACTLSGQLGLEDGHRNSSSLLKRRFAKRGVLETLLAAWSPQPVRGDFPKSFDMAAKKSRRSGQYADLPTNVLFRE